MKIGFTCPVFNPIREEIVLRRMDILVVISGRTNREAIKASRMKLGFFLKLDTHELKVIQQMVNLMVVIKQGSQYVYTLFRYIDTPF